MTECFRYIHRGLAAGYKHVSLSFWQSFPCFGDSPPRLLGGSLAQFVPAPGHCFLFAFNAECCFK